MTLGGRRIATSLDEPARPDGPQARPSSPPHDKLVQPHPWGAPLPTDRAETLLDCLLHWELHRPDEVYLTQPLANGSVLNFTWRQVAEQSRRMARYLVQLDLPAGSSIALMGKNSAHWIMADLAIWMAGHVSVPLYATLNPDAVRHVIDHSEARLLIIGRMDELWSPLAAHLPRTLPRLALPMAPSMDAPRWSELLPAFEPLSRFVARGPRELASIIYTSGSTGVPKGVMISFEAMMALRRTGELFDIGPHDRALSYLPLAHALERAMIEASSLIFGFRVFFAYGLDTFVDDIKRARPTVFISVPRLWAKFYQSVSDRLPPQKLQRLLTIPVVSAVTRAKVLRQLGLDHVRVAWTGSAPLAPALIDWYRALGLELLEGYAMTENFAYSHTSRPGRTRVGYVGHANPGVQHRIDPGSGEVQVRGPGSMMGYFKEPRLSADAFTADGFLKTGDMGELDEQGRLRITGRVKELFKTSKGKYVAPQPIEKLLAAHPAVGMACVTGVGLPQPVAVVCLADEVMAKLAQGRLSAHDVEVELASLMARVNETLEAHERLGALVLSREAWTIANGMLTPTMKIRRNLVERRYEPAFGSDHVQGVSWV
jgi:long-subunit acyl-CoA synthetase (AMP-forming)